MRPSIRFLTDDLIKQIIDEAVNILCNLGMKIRNKQLLSLLADHNARVDMDNLHVKFTEDIIQKAIKSAPDSFKLYDVMGKQTHDFSDYNVHFTPGSSALNILDGPTQQIRKPNTHIPVMKRNKYLYPDAPGYLSNRAPPSTGIKMSGT